MNKQIHDAFDSIKAEEKLKQDTLAYLERKINQKKPSPFRKYAVTFASAILLILAGFFSYDLYFSEAFYLDLDVNPSIELTLNRLDRVIATNAYNEDGELILSKVSINNKTYKEALKILIDEMIEQGYIEDSTSFYATLQTDKIKNDRDLLNELKQYIDTVLVSNSKAVEQNIFEVDSKTKSASHALHLSPAKYLAITELQSLDPTATFEHCRDHSISEIHDQINDCKDNHTGTDGNSEHHDSDQGHGENSSDHDNGH